MKHDLLPNQTVRRHAKKNGVRIYELGDVLGVSQATITRKLRYEMGEADTNRYIAAINTIIDRRAAGA